MLNQGGYDPMKAERHPSAHEMCSAQPLYTAAERRFVEAMNAAADDGVGFGWMQQVAEWEWLHRHGHVGLIYE